MDLEPPEKIRKSSIIENEFKTALIICYQKLLKALKILPNEGWVLCFTGSMLVRTVNRDKYAKQCYDFLFWRYSTYGRITDDCDVIFEEDPPEDVQRNIRHYNRNLKRMGLPIDWWNSKYYESTEWSYIKARSLNDSNEISNIPVQPLHVLFYAKKIVLTGPKHEEDAQNLFLL